MGLAGLIYITLSDVYFCLTISGLSFEPIHHKYYTEVTAIHNDIVTRLARTP